MWLIRVHGCSSTVGKITETQLTFKQFIFMKYKTPVNFLVLLYLTYIFVPLRLKKMQILKSDIQHLTPITNISPPKLADEMSFTWGLEVHTTPPMRIDIEYSQIATRQRIYLYMYCNSSCRRVVCTRQSYYINLQNCDAFSFRAEQIGYN